MQSVRTTVQVVEVDAQENGRKLFSFLEARLGSLPPGLLMRLVRTGQVRIDGRRCKPFDRVLTGQKVRIPPVNVELKELAARPYRALRSCMRMRPCWWSTSRPDCRSMAVQAGQIPCMTV